MTRNIENILSKFDESDFKDIPKNEWKSKFEYSNLILFYGDYFITVDTVFKIYNSGRKVKLSDMSRINYTS